MVQLQLAGVRAGGEGVSSRTPDAEQLRTSPPPPSPRRDPLAPRSPRGARARAGDPNSRPRDPMPKPRPATHGSISEPRGPRSPPARPEPARRPAAAAAGATREAEQPAAENASERDAQSRARKRRPGRAERPPAALPPDTCHVGDRHGYPRSEGKHHRRARSPEASSKSPNAHRGCFLFFCISEGERKYLRNY